MIYPGHLFNLPNVLPGKQNNQEDARREPVCRMFCADAMPARHWNVPPWQPQSFAPYAKLDHLLRYVDEDIDDDEDRHSDNGDSIDVDESYEDLSVFKEGDTPCANQATNPQANHGEIWYMEQYPAETFFATPTATRALTSEHRAWIVRNHLTSQAGGLALMIRKTTGASVTVENRHVHFAGLVKENLHTAQVTLWSLLNSADRREYFIALRRQALHECKRRGERADYACIMALKFQT